MARDCTKIALEIVWIGIAQKDMLSVLGAPSFKYKNYKEGCSMRIGRWSFMRSLVISFGFLKTLFSFVCLLWIIGLKKSIWPMMIGSTSANHRYFTGGINPSICHKWDTCFAIKQILIDYVHYALFWERYFNTCFGEYKKNVLLFVLSHTDMLRVFKFI